jgi:Flp pilus assembly secretin CpaC
MTPRMLVSTALLAAVIAAGGFPPDQAPAAESDMHVISSDVTARFVPLGLNKAVVIEMPADIKDVLVANPKVVNATVAQTRRRAYIVGAGLGQTNVYFFGPDGRQVGALDIAVSDVAQPDSPPLLENSALPVNVITVYLGDKLVFYRCKNTCSPPALSAADRTGSHSDTKIVDMDAKGNVTSTRSINTSNKPGD